MSKPGPEPKPRWSSVPVGVRTRLEHTFGVDIRRATRAWGGYGPTPTFRMLLADGRRYFVKGLNDEATDKMRDGFHLERRVYEELQPFIAEWSPAYVCAIEEAGWQFMVLEDLGPSSVPPWTVDEAQLAVRALASFHAGQPEDELPEWVPRHHEWRAELGRDWSWASNREDLIDRASVAGSSCEAAAAWLVDKAALAPGPDRRSEDDVLLHHDVRSDNLRIVDDRLVLFDWASVRLGPAEEDLVSLAPTLHLEADLDFSEIVEWYGAVRPIRHDALFGAVISAFGFFVDQAWRPPIPRLPRLRGFQIDQMVATGRWLCRLLSEDEPSWLSTVAVDPSRT